MYTVTEAALRLSCSTRTLRRRILAGELPVFRDRGLVRIAERDLETFVASRTVARRLAVAPTFTAQAAAGPTALLLASGLRLSDLDPGLTTDIAGT
jgi:excisionase family DNA binding protein